MSAPVKSSKTNNVLPAQPYKRPTQIAQNQNGTTYDNELFDQAGAEEVILTTAGYDHTIKFWQAHTGQCLRTIQHTDSQVNAMEISPDGQLLAACGYQHIRMFDAQGTNASPVVNYEGVTKNVMDVGFQDKGRWMYTGGEDGTVKLWDLRMRNLQCQKIFQAKAPVTSVTLHPNQQDIMIGDQNGVVHIWNIKSDQSEQWVPEPGASIQCVAVDPLGQHAAAVTNKATCHIWELDIDGAISKTSLHPRKPFSCHQRYALKCVFSPDSTLLATSSADQTARLWRTSDLELISELHTENQRWVWDIAFSADSQYLFTASSDSVARLWSLNNNEVKRKYVGHQKALTCLAFRDGQAG